MTVIAGPRRRLDLVLVERSLAPSRERAQALIAAGLVEVSGAMAHSASQAVTDASEVRILGKDHPWVGRGGVKLAAALDHFSIDPHGRVALDAGASTGGFTDVLLQRGAVRVYAVDVGHGQLDGGLRNNPRVEVMDRTNLRTLTMLPGPAPSLVTLDLSFISLTLVLEAVQRLAEPGAEVVALYKPQFELGREVVPRGGVVRDDAVGERGAAGLAGWALHQLGARCEGLLASPVRGAKGNQEWLLHLRLPGGGSTP